MDISVPAQVSQVEKKIFTGLPARAIKLLGTGCLQVEVAKALGVTEGQVSQWMGDTEFRQQVNDIVAKTFAEQSVIDENYIKIEQKLSERLLAATEHMYNPDTILRTLKFANEAKRKVIPNGQTPGSGGNVTILAPVTLVLPQAVAKEFILNPNNEVVGIDGNEVMTLPSANVRQLAETVRAATPTLDANLKKVAKKLNGSGHKDPWSDL